MNTPVFDDLVSGFYKAATGEQDWSQALDGVQKAFSARTAILQSVDVRTGQLLALHNGGPPMNEAMFDYVREYHQIDPRRERLIAFSQTGLGTWWHCHEHFDDVFVAKNRFYQEFLPAYDTRYVSTVLAMPSEHVLTGFALELPATRGVLTADERETARRLGIHMQDALRAYQRVRELTAQSLAGHALLRSFPYPMWLVDEERFIHFANDAAVAAVDTGEYMAQRGSQLLIDQHTANHSLTERLHVLKSAPHGEACVLQLRAPKGGLPSWLHLSVVVPEAVLGAFGSRRLVIITLFDPALVHSLDPFALSRLFGLTPAQARVAVSLADGLTAKQIAETCGCTVATVRTHIREVFVKLGAQRIADVVRVLRDGQAMWSTNVRP